MNIIDYYNLAVLIPLSILTVIAVYNYFTAPRLLTSKIIKDYNPLISILIPARNEEKNIKNCIESILNQGYKNIEIIVLDDCSTDKTADVVKKIYSKEVSLMSGKSLPENWLGKNWACHQLAQEAKGDIYIFIDADVTIKPAAVESALEQLHLSKSDMLSVFPTQLISTFGEYLVVPLMNWILLNFLPLRFVRSSKNESFVAANGQFILIKKHVYKKAGGHSEFKNKVVEDMEIARKVKGMGYKVITLLGDKLIYCNMYNGFISSVNGFSKNFYQGFNISAISFVVLVIFIELIYLVPLILTLVSYEFTIAALLILVSRLIIAGTSRQNILSVVILHPLQMLILLYVGIKSVSNSINKGNEWKGRVLK